MDWIDSWPHTSSGIIFLDIGANVGVYSLYAAAMYPSIKAFAIEPEIANAFYLRQHIAWNRLPNVTPLVVALDQRAGLQTLHVSDPQPGAALHTLDQHAPCTSHDELVAVWTIDRLCQTLCIQPTYLKLDVDGQELEVLRGAEQTLRGDSLKSMMLELSEELRDECAELLQQSGWTCVKRWPYRREYRNVLYAGWYEQWDRMTRPEADCP